MCMDLHEKSLHLTPKRIESLERLGIHDTDELFSYYPYRYDIINPKPFSEWQIKEKVIFEAEVVSKVTTWRHGKVTTSHFDVMTDDQVLKVTIFNRPWANRLSLNQIITINGVYMGKGKVTAMSYDMKPLSQHDRITPVYSTREGITQRTIRDCMKKVYEEMENEIRDNVPEEYIRAYRLLRKSDAIRRIHFPENERDIQLARRTLKYEEFLRFFVSMQLMKNEEGAGIYKEPKQFDETKIHHVIENLGFDLTPDQHTALEDVLKDMASTHPMYRLVQGDVGCGKTIVAVLALYACALSGMQGALLAPTGILALQHLESLQKILKDTGVHMEVLYSGLNEEKKQEVLQGLQDGSVQIAVGTHSLIQPDVVFDRLGLVVADEQQRFGVDQRKALRAKGDNPDFLLMSATPIPRTLASTLFGDMDISTIETMPPGRKTPVTKLIMENSFRSVLPEVKNLLKEGHQLYVICAAVDQSEGYDARNVHDTAAALTKLFAPDRVGILHGQMKNEEKDEVMEAFAKNEIQVLVSTTVVEVGVNVVNATGMIVYDADRFGLSQLHQLRGRIQRGSSQGYCWLLTGNQDEHVKERLNVLVKSNNGFEISYQDLRLRGPGDILGTRQSGVPDLILGNLTEDTNIINTARKDAEHIVDHADNPDYASILDTVRKRSTQDDSWVD